MWMENSPALEGTRRCLKISCAGYLSTVKSMHVGNKNRTDSYRVPTGLAYVSRMNQVLPGLRTQYGCN